MYLFFIINRTLQNFIIENKFILRFSCQGWVDLKQSLSPLKILEVNFNNKSDFPSVWSDGKNLFSEFKYLNGTSVTWT